MEPFGSHWVKPQRTGLFQPTEMRGFLWSLENHGDHVISMYIMVISMYIMVTSFSRWNVIKSGWHRLWSSLDKQHLYVYFSLSFGNLAWQCGHLPQTCVSLIQIQSSLDHLVVSAWRDAEEDKNHKNLQVEALSLPLTKWLQIGSSWTINSMVISTTFNCYFGPEICSKTQTMAWELLICCWGMAKFGYAFPSDFQSSGLDEATDTRRSVIFQSFQST